MLGCWVVCGFEVCEVDVFLGVILRDIGYSAFLLDLRLVYRWNYLFKLEVLGNLDLYLLLWLHLRLFRRHTLCLILFDVATNLSKITGDRLNPNWLCCQNLP